MCNIELFYIAGEVDVEQGECVTESELKDYKFKKKKRARKMEGKEGTERTRLVGNQNSANTSAAGPTAEERRPCRYSLLGIRMRSGAGAVRAHVS